MVSGIIALAASAGPTQLPFANCTLNTRVLSSSHDRCLSACNHRCMSDALSDAIYCASVAASPEAPPPLPKAPPLPRTPSPSASPLNEPPTQPFISPSDSFARPRECSTMDNWRAEINRIVDEINRAAPDPAASYNDLEHIASIHARFARACSRILRDLRGARPLDNCSGFAESIDMRACSVAQQDQVSSFFGGDCGSTVESFQHTLNRSAEVVRLCDTSVCEIKPRYEALSTFVYRTVSQLLMENELSMSTGGGSLTRAGNLNQIEGQMSSFMSRVDLDCTRIPNRPIPTPWILSSEQISGNIQAILGQLRAQG